LLQDAITQIYSFLRESDRLWDLARAMIDTIRVARRTRHGSAGAQRAPATSSDAVEVDDHGKLTGAVLNGLPSLLATAKDKYSVFNHQRGSLLSL
jgi:hypothetical protein